MITERAGAAALGVASVAGILVQLGGLVCRPSLGAENGG